MRTLAVTTVGAALALGGGGGVMGTTREEAGVHVELVYLGPSLQYFVRPDVFIGGGVGFVGQTVRVAAPVPASDDTGAVTLRVGLAGLQRRRHALNVSAESIVGRFDGRWTTGGFFLVGYQLYWSLPGTRLDRSRPASL